MIRGGAPVIDAVAVTCETVARRAVTADPPSTPVADVVQAAGGLVVRRQLARLEIAVVHRPVQQDWSFPKGKLEEGETLDLTAVREVYEETGLVCRLIRFMGHTEYVDRKRRPKVVAYWIMAAESGQFAPNDEVDELRWMALSAASDLLSYPRDQELVGSVGRRRHGGSRHLTLPAQTPASSRISLHTSVADRE